MGNAARFLNSECRMQIAKTERASRYYRRAGARTLVRSNAPICNRHRRYGALKKWVDRETLKKGSAFCGLQTPPINGGVNETHAERGKQSQLLILPSPIRRNHGVFRILLRTKVSRSARLNWVLGSARKNAPQLRRPEPTSSPPIHLTLCGTNEKSSRWPHGRTLLKRVT